MYAETIVAYCFYTSVALRLWAPCLFPLAAESRQFVQYMSGQRPPFASAIETEDSEKRRG